MNVTTTVKTDEQDRAWDEAQGAELRAIEGGTDPSFFGRDPLYTPGNFGMDDLSKTIVQRLQDAITPVKL